MLHEARRFFAERDVLEVETPALSPAAVSDPHIESICARLELRTAAPCFLRTSPEFAMKRLLAAGYPDIFEIGRVFRDGEAGPAHQPEFTLIEWYRHGFDLEQIMTETVSLLSALIEASRVPKPVVFTSYRDAFLDFAGVDPFTADIDALRRASSADARLIAAVGDRRDDWLDLLLATHVAPRFETDRLTVLYHYPASQAALARLVSGNVDLAERFEVFKGNVELANGFVELDDAHEQAARFARDQANRRERGKTVRPLDRRLLAALASGLPACAGVAAGLERILMINQATADISDVISFSFEGET